MPPPIPTPTDQHRVPLRRETAEQLKKRFPDASYDEAILWLLKRDSLSAGDTATCATTELWIKLDRLEEMLGLLALTNVDVADLYKRQVGEELMTLRHVSGELADIALVHGKGGRAA